MIQKKSLPEFYYQIADLIKNSGAYLVGGAVRDLLLGRSVHDLDFALPVDSISLARKVADQLGGDFFILDQERESARVILRDENGQRLMVDFTLFQGDTIENDLQARDFTITSLGIDLLQEEKILDLFQGVRDLKDRVIQTTTPTAIQNDALRCLRAVRLAAQLNFRILPETLEQIHHYQGGLSEVSPERIRDELFRILAGPNQTAALGTLKQLGTYPLILPGLFSARQQENTRWLEKFWSLLMSAHDQDSAANWAMGLYVHRLGRYRQLIKDHLAVELVPGRSVSQLSFLSLLLFPFWEEAPGEHSLPEIPLSNQEIDRLQKASQGARDFIALTADQVVLSPLAIYRYFRSHGPAGVEGIFLGLADLFEIKSSTADQNWPVALEAARSLLEGWWEKRDTWVDPPTLLNGHDLQQEFNLNPGPRIGEFLEKLREAQVSTGLDTHQGALQFIEGLLTTQERPAND